MKQVLIFISLIATTFGAAYLFDVAKLEMDCVAILSLLVTLLLGWQIYSLVDVHQVRKELDAQKAQTQRDLNELYVDCYNSMAIVCDRAGDKFYSVLNLLQKCIYQSRLGQFDKCSNTIMVILLTDGNIYAEQYQIDVIYTLMTRIENANEIKRFPELTRFIRNRIILIQNTTKLPQITPT